MFEHREITYSTGEIEELAGGEISQKQIRYWENKGYIPKAERNICGDIAYRRFTLNQLELIRSIKMYLNQGYTLARAAELALTTEECHWMGNGGGHILSMVKIIEMELERTDETEKMADIK